MVVLIDTDVWIDYFSGFEPSAGIVESLLLERRATISTISVFELTAGVVSKKKLADLDKLFEMVPIISLDSQISRLAGQQYTYLKSRGKLIANQDLFIAATAVSNSIPLLTRNVKHFSRIRELNLYSLTSERV
jgi:predicted nucleic acid-binding protein